MNTTLAAAVFLSTVAVIPGALTMRPQVRPAVVKVFTDEPAFTADVSRDGRLAAVFTRPYGAGTDADPATIEVRNLLTQERITLAGGLSNVGTPGRPAAAFSPDSRLIAYTWFDKQLTDTGMLQLIGTEFGARPRTLIPADPTDIGIIPHGWSPDGTRVLVLVHGPSVTMSQDPTFLEWVSVSDGRRRRIKTLEPWRDGGSALPRLSRDGRWIAYSAVTRQGSTQRAIYVVDAESGAERVILALPGSSSAPVWSPDSSHVVFLNRLDGSARPDLVAVDVSAPEKQLTRLESGFKGAPIAITDAGTLYSTQFDFGWLSVVVEPSDRGGRVTEAFSGHGVAWRNDHELAFVNAGADVIGRTLGSGAERAYVQRSLSGIGPRILGDGSAAVVYVPASGDDGRAGGGFYRLDFTSGEFRRLFSRDSGDRTRSSVSALSPDSKTLFLGVLAGTPVRWSSVVGIDLDSGQELRTLALPDSIASVQGISVSPDGSMLALHAMDGRILTYRIEDGSVREVVGAASGGGWPEVVRWSRDGRYIVYATRPDASSTVWRILRVQASGGLPEPFGVDSSALTRPGRLISFDLSPDDRRVAVTARTDRSFDVLVLDGVASRIQSPR